MNWKLILQLSVFGLAMGIATVYFVPSNTEPFYWLAIFVYCAYVIARKVDQKVFLHGFLVGLVNSVWITTAHIVLFDSYIANHQQEAAMMTTMSGIEPRLMMAVTGPVIGALSGVVLGLFSVVADKLLRNRVKAA